MLVDMDDRDPIARLNAALEGRYRIESELGEGGMATVYLADDLKHERRVALKVLKPELAALVGAERFLLEIRTTANLQHPHILPLHDSGEADGLLFYVTPFVEGESLRDRLDRERQLPVDDAVRIATNMAEALDYAHCRGVVHRDIKPANVLLQDGKPVIADFGIALAVGAGDGDRLTETGLSLGTPQYMSPEQAMGDQTTGAATDIYALGCVLYEMFVGEPPFTGSTPQAVLGKIITMEVPPARAERSSVPRNADAAIAKALQKVPADRFPRAAAFAEALADPTYGIGVVSESDGAASSVAWWQRGTVVLGLAIAAVALGVWAWLDAVRQPDPQLMRFTLERGFEDISFDGSRLLFVDGDITVRDVHSLESRSLGVTGQSATFSPDGTSIVVGNYGEIIRVPIAGGPPAIVTRGLVAGAPTRGLAWGSDDNIYLSNGYNDPLSRVAADGGEPEQVTVLDTLGGEVSHSFPVPLGSRGILFRSEWVDSSRVMVYSFESGETVRIGRGTDAAYDPAGYLLLRKESGVLEASRFDLESLSRTGDPVQWLADVGRFRVAGNGTLLYHPWTEAQRAVVLVDWVGRETPIVSDTAGFRRGASLSPDGTRVLVSRQFPQAPGSVLSNSYLWVYEVGGEGRQITTEGTSGLAVWSTDGEWVFFASIREGSFGIYRKRADGIGESERLASFDGAMFPTQATDTGVLVDRPSTRGTMVVPVDGSSEPRLLLPACDTACNGAQISPDGRYALYRPGQSGEVREDIFVAEIGNWMATRQQVTVGGATWSGHWLPDGTGILHMDWEGAIVETTVERRDGALHIGQRRTLFDTNGRGYYLGYDARPDPLGRGLVMVKNAGASGPGTVVVLNFLEELGQLLGR
jgi:hypothetical protein